MLIRLSRDQKEALKNILEWYAKDREKMQYVTLGGFAGTGKTTLISCLRQELETADPGLKVGFISYTGKATRVLSDILQQSGTLRRQDTVSTIHALIYTPVLNEREEIVGWKKKDSIDRKLIIVDEASMVDADIWRHLLSFGVPVIAVGDHGQLPPIRGTFHLMHTPHLTLTEIHRQAKKHPIIRISVQARKHGAIDPGRYGPGVVKYDRSDPMASETMQEMLTNYSPDTLVLCGYNSTRNRLNAGIRQALGFATSQPEAGDRVICLRNNHASRIYNGMLGTIRRITRKSDAIYETAIQLDGEQDMFEGSVAAEQFGARSALNYTDMRKRFSGVDLFDFGYAITVHKAQGSQAKRVMLFEERFPSMDDGQWKRWLYTAVTRAQEELYIFPSV